MFRPSWSVANPFTGISRMFSLAEPFQLQKITRVLHILAEINIQFPHDKYAKLKTYI